LVISPDLINERSPIVIVAAITSKKTNHIYPFEVLIEPPEGGLDLRSKVMLMQIRAVDKRRLVGNYGSIGANTMRLVEKAIQIATSLIPI
jgi:mRNA interferase MazF